MPLDFEGLMRNYARRGIADWKDIKSTPRELRDRARDCLGLGIAQDEPQAFVTISTTFDGTNLDRLRFIPMPKLPSRPGIDRCFFLPVRRRWPGGQETVVFELFLLVAQKNCLAFRFEPKHRRGDAHIYGHVQLCRTLSRPVTGVPPWLPDKYPAFPTSVSEPLGGFLCMATAVHGHGTGVVPILEEIFQGRPFELARYIDELKKVLA
jgi:hypothetical protein